MTSSKISLERHRLRLLAAGLLALGVIALRPAPTVSVGDEQPAGGPVPAAAQSALPARATPVLGGGTIDIAACSSQFGFTGTGLCGRCHSGGDRGEPITGTDRWLTGKAFDDWAEHDIHARAYDLLDSPLGQQMEKILGWGTKVTEDTRCTNCHFPYKDEIQAVSRSERTGVTCEGCHGPAKEWLGKHFARDWRFAKSADKAKEGMVDLRDPVVQTEVCLSCHLGNRRLDRVVTHEMYAAGHPPLPSVEIATFADSVGQRHWRYLPEKRTGGPDAEKAVAEFLDKTAHEDAASPKSRLLLFGSVGTLRQSADLIAGEAATALTAEAGGRRWPELATFDCYACHHDLRYPGWRQQTYRAGSVPGRPLLQRWPTVLVHLALQHAGLEPALLTDAVKDLDGVIQAQPFGNPADIPAAANKVIALCDTLADKLRNRPFGPADSAALYSHLLTLAEQQQDQLDYESARQVIWGLRILASEAGDALPNRAPILVSLDRVASEIVQADLPARTKQAIADQLAAALESVNAYTPADFRRHLGELRAVGK